LIPEAKFSGYMALITGALGFAAPWPYIVAGMFFAVAGGFVGMVVSPPTERLTLPLTVVVAMVIGAFAGMAHPHFAAGGAWIGWVSALPLPLVMGVAGLASPWLARRAASGNMSLPWKRGEGQ